jgi:hypothetical protein
MPRRLPIFATLVLVLTLLAPHAARAQAAPEEPKKEWYGWQILAVDALGWAMLIAAAQTESLDGSGDDGVSGYLALGGVVTLIAGGPIIHVQNDNGHGAALSLTGRLLLPVLGAAAGVVLFTLSGDGCDYDCDGPDFRALGGIIIGGFIGVATSEALDWTVLSSPRRSPTGTGPATGPYRGPMFMYVPSGAGVGFGGTF